MEKRMVRQYLTKLRGHSYKRSVWMTQDEIEEDGKLSKNALARFLKKLGDGEPIDDSYQKWTSVQRVIGHRRVAGFYEFLVKWEQLPYNDCSWELASEIPPQAVDAYNLVSNRFAAEEVVEQRKREKESAYSWLSKGMPIEVAPPEGTETAPAWFAAIAVVLHEGKHDTSVTVDYRDLLVDEDDLDGAKRRERVKVGRARPQPPKMKKEWRPEVGSTVQLRHVEGWWGGTVSSLVKKGEPLPDERSEEAKLAEALALLMPPLDPNDKESALGRREEGRDGRIWELAPVGGAAAEEEEPKPPALPVLPVLPHDAEDCGVCINCRDKPKFGGPGTRRQGCLAKKVPGGGAAAAKPAKRQLRQWALCEQPSDAAAADDAYSKHLAALAAAEAEAASGCRGRKSRRVSAASEKPAKKVSRTLKGMPRAELPGARLVVIYSEEDVAAAADEKPTEGAALVGCFIEVHWPLDKAWYKAQVLRHIPARKNTFESYELLYVDDNMKEVVCLEKEEWRHVVAMIRTAYRGMLIRAAKPGTDEEGLLVRFDVADSEDADAECWIDEDGDDEWCWEANFRRGKNMRVIEVEPELAKETMHFVKSAVGQIEHWLPLGSLRPNWVWRGAESGFEEVEDPAEAACVAAPPAEEKAAEEGEAEEAEEMVEVSEEEQARLLKALEQSRANEAKEDLEGCEMDEEEDEGDGDGDGAEGAVGEAQGRGRARGGARQAEREDASYREEGEAGAGAGADGGDDSSSGEDEQEPMQVSGWSKLNSSPPLHSGRELRPYQLDGLNWLRLNWYLGRNVILGDEMGLGKTAQSLSLLQSLRSMEEVEGPFLIVAPNYSLLITNY
jgi:hypothetical protein